jgi:hypothetical protein
VLLASLSGKIRRFCVILGRSESQEDAMDEKLLAEWRQRVANGNFSAGVAGVREIRVFGRAGDEVVCFPQLSSPMALDTLEPDERAAVMMATTLIEAHRQRGRAVFAVTPGARGNVPAGQTLDRLDLTQADHILVLSQITGG